MTLNTVQCLLRLSIDYSEGYVPVFLGLGLRLFVLVFLELGLRLFVPVFLGLGCRVI